MKKYVLFLLVVCFSLFAVNFVGAATNVSSCQTLSSANTEYVLNTSINSSGTCITINANNITLDGAGYTINYSQGNNSYVYGVFVNVSNYTTVKNTHIFLGNDSESNWPTYAIYYLNATGGVVTNNTINTSSGGSAGIVLLGIDGMAITNNTVIAYSTYYSIGIFLAEAINNTVQNNFVNSTSYSIGVAGGYNNTIYNNTVFSRYSDASFNAAIQLTESDIGSPMLLGGTVIDQNVIETTGDGIAGIRFATVIAMSPNNRITNNIITTNGTSSHGLNLGSVRNGTINGNIITTYKNTSDGMRLAIANSTLRSNSITTYGNGSRGIAILAGGPGTGFGPCSFYDSTINSLEYYNIFLLGDITGDALNNSFINVSYIGTNQSENVSKGEMIRKWYLNVNSNLEGVSISITNSSAGSVYSGSTNSSLSVPRQTIMEYTLINGTYSYYSNYSISASKTGYDSGSSSVNLSDYTSNRGNKIVSLSLSETSSDSSSGSSGGGSTSSFWTSTQAVTDEQFKEGYTKELGVKERVKISVGAQTHYVGVKNLTTTSATIEITSDPVTVILEVGEERKLDLTDDGFYDLRVNLLGIANNKADVKVLEIHEEIPEGEGAVSGGTAETTTVGSESEDEEPEEKEGLMWLWILLGILLVSAVVGTIIIMKTNRLAFDFKQLSTGRFLKRV